MATTTATARAGVKTTAGKSRASISQMETYVWTGLDKRGQRMKGEFTTKNASLVKAELRRQGINPQSVKAKAKPLFGKAGKSIKPRDISIFSRQLATMMAAGVPMVQGFEIVAGGQSNPRVKDMLVDIKTDIEGGSALNEALASTRSSLMSYIATWFVPANPPVCLIPCWIRLPLTRKTSRPSRARSRRPCSTRPWCWVLRFWCLPSC